MEKITPNTWGGDHALKFGFKYRNDIAHTESMYGGDAYARTRNGLPVEAQIYRRGYTRYGLHNRNVYLQDTFTKGRVTVNAGFRFDYQTDYANAAEVSANQSSASPPTWASTTGSPTLARRSTSCRRSSSPARTRVWRSRTGRRAWASPTT